MNQFKPQRIAAISLVALAILIHLTGCTFCRENRAVCVAGGAMVLEGVVAASADHRGTVHSFAPAICSTQPSACR